MIVKVEIDGDCAHVTTGPKESAKNTIRMVVPADRMRRRFASGLPMAGFFAAQLAVTKRIDTQEDLPLDVLEIGDRLPMPQEAW